VARVGRTESPDAVVVLPGIMGSELVDADSGTMLWGGQPSWYVRAWTTGRELDLLRVTEDELNGNVGRVKASRLVQFPAFAPVLRGLEPYRGLVTRLKEHVRHPDAVMAFPYDWRLGVRLAATQLAEAAQRHLATWRAHPQGSRDARLFLVGHSMGGLVALDFLENFGDVADLRSIVCLGSPFYGSVKTVHVLSSGLGSPVPLPQRRFREIAITMPGVYDLLPRYRCVDEGVDARFVTASDLAELGADPALAAAALARPLPGAQTPPGLLLKCVVGVGFPTMQSLTMRDGLVSVGYHVCDNTTTPMSRIDRSGDSVVYRDSAVHPAAQADYIPQSHATLARTSEVVAYVISVLTERPLGPMLADTSDAIGFGIPDIVAVGQRFDIDIAHADPAKVSYRVVDPLTGETQLSGHPILSRDRLTASMQINRSGLYRVQVDASGFSPSEQLLMVVPAMEVTP